MTELRQRDITSFLDFNEPPLPEIFFIPASEFPYLKEHSIRRSCGCASKSLSGAWIFLEYLVSGRNISWLDLSECCWHCKLAYEKVEVRHGEKVSIYSCSIEYDNWIQAYIDEINRVTVHELIHACGLVINERQTERATSALTPDWSPCRKWIKGES